MVLFSSTSKQFAGVVEGGGLKFHYRNLLGFKSHACQFPKHPHAQSRDVRLVHLEPTCGGKCVCVCACVCHLPSVSIDDGAATMKKAQQAPLQLQSSRAPQELQRLQSSSEAAELPRSSKAHTSLLCFYKSPELPQAAPSFSEAPELPRASPSKPSFCEKQIPPPLPPLGGGEGGGGEGGRGKLLQAKWCRRRVGWGCSTAGRSGFLEVF